VKVFAEFAEVLKKYEERQAQTPIAADGDASKE